MIVILIIPIWTFKYFPSQDGPAHLHNIDALHHYRSATLTVFQKYYAINHDPNPNWSGHIILFVLSFVVPVLVAEKILLTCYVVVFPIAFRYLTRPLETSSIAGFLVLPFVYNYTLHVGFYNFCFSIALYFFCFGFWLRNLHDLKLSKVLFLAVIFLVLYFTHPVSLVCAYMSCGAVLLFHVALKRDFTIGGSKSQPISFRQIVYTLAAALPSLILMLWFMLRQQTQVAVFSLTSPKRLVNSLISFQISEGYIYLVLILGLIVLGSIIFISRLRHSFSLLSGDSLFLLLAGFVLAFMLTPEALANGSSMHARLAVYVWLSMIIWIVTNPWGLKTSWTIRIISIGLTLALLGMNVRKYHEINSYLDEYISVQSQLPSGTTLLPVSFWERGNRAHPKSLRVDPFLHAGGYVVLGKAVDLGNYEARLNYFPLQFRPELDPQPLINTEEIEKFRADVSQYNKTRGSIDYVLIWQEERAPAASNKGVKQFLKELKSEYVLVGRSMPSGAAQLYKRSAGE